MWRQCQWGGQGQSLLQATGTCSPLVAETTAANFARRRRCRLLSATTLRQTLGPLSALWRWADVRPPLLSSENSWLYNTTVVESKRIHIHRLWFVVGSSEWRRGSPIGRSYMYVTVCNKTLTKSEDVCVTSLYIKESLVRTCTHVHSISILKSPG